MNTYFKPAKNQGYRIGEVAKAVGVNIQTLRYYERLQLLLPKARRESGYRIYSDGEVKRIRFIKKAQELGFSLKEIEGLLKLRVTSSSQCESVRRKAVAKLAEVEKKLTQLGAIRRVLKELIASCHSEKTTDSCPILRSLEEGTKRGKESLC